MRSFVLIVFGFLFINGFAFAQEETPPPSAPVLSEKTVEKTLEEAAENTDLGSSVDDLLESTLKPGETAPNAVPARPEAGAVQLTPNVDAAGPVSTDIVNAETGIVGATVEVEGFPEEQEAPVKAYDPYSSATLRALDKITGRSTDIDVETGTPIVFGSLNIEMKACFQTPPELPPESAAFLDIKSTKPLRTKAGEKLAVISQDGEVDLPQLFSGWMFASSPGLSALEHSVYDVWVISCKAS